MVRRSRRKATSSHRKAPLKFTDSPLNGAHQPVETVLGADDPATAQVVPIDPDSSFPWISPHFHNAVPSTRKRYATRSSRHRRNPVLCMTASNRNASTASVRRTCHPNTVRLRFVGEETIDSDDDDITDDEDAPPIAGNCETPEGNVPQRLQGDDDGNSRKGKYTWIKPLVIERVSDEGELATQRPKHTAGVSARRLFCGTIENKMEDTENDKADNMSFECTARTRSAVAPRLLNHSMNMSDVDCCLPTIHHVRRSSRSLQHTLLDCNVHTPEAQKIGNNKILAFDTPVTDYGLSVRLRRLKGRLKM